MGLDREQSPLHPLPLLPGQIKHHPPPSKAEQVQTLNDQFWQQQYRANQTLLQHRTELAHIELMNQNDGTDLMELRAKYGKHQRVIHNRELKRAGFSEPSVYMKHMHGEYMSELRQATKLYKSKSSYSDDKWKSPQITRAAFGTSARSFPLANIPGVAEGTCGATIVIADVVTGNTQLHMAASQGQYAMMASAVDCAPEELVNAKNSLGDTALHIACDMGSTAIVDLLLQNGADLTLRSNDDDTCLHRAVQSRHVTTVILLIGKRAEINCQNRFGHSPLHTAAANSDTECCETLLSSKANLQLRDPNWHTPLFAATSRGCTNTARTLVEAMASVHKTDREGNTVLHIAVGNGDVALTHYLLNVRGNLQKRNARKEAPIDVAFRNGQLKTLEWIFTKSDYRTPLREKVTPKRLAFGGVNLNHDYMLPKGPLRETFMERGAVPKDVKRGMRITNLKVWPVLAAEAHCTATGTLGSMTFDIEEAEELLG